MELLCVCSCRLNRGHQPGTLTPLGKPTSFQGFEEEGISPGTGQATRPIQDLPDRPGRHRSPIQGSGWALCKGPVGHAVGVGPGGPPAASAALSAGRRTASPNPIGHTRAGIARVTSQQHLSRRWVLLCCSDFPIDFSVGNSRFQTHPSRFLLLPPSPARFRLSLSPAPLSLVGLVAQR